MKRLLLTVFSFISLFSFGQYADDAQTNERIRILLHKFVNASLDSTEKRTITNLTYDIQNRGFGEKDHQKALVEIDRAILIWTTMRDTPNEANLLKYRGYLLGKLKRFAEAKKDIDNAIQLFTLKNRMYGVAVSQYDLSLVYDMESKTDSAIHYALLASNYWKGQGQAMRMLTINNHLIKLYGQTKRWKDALAIQQQTGALLKDHGEVDQFNLVYLTDFYFLSKMLFAKTEQKTPAEKYRNLFENRVQRFKDQNIKYNPEDRGFKVF